jgi:hypothetical protein
VSDEEVIQRAPNSQALHVTEDKDFGELVYSREMAHAGVLFDTSRRPSPSAQRRGRSRAPERQSTKARPDIIVARRRFLFDFSLDVI